MLTVVRPLRSAAVVLVGGGVVPPPSSAPKVPRPGPPPSSRLLHHPPPRPPRDRAAVLRPPPTTTTHVLGCGPIGLLYASALCEAAARDDDDDDDDGAAVALLLRPGHESRLGWDRDDDDDDDVGSSSRNHRTRPRRRIARVVVRRPPSSIDDHRRRGRVGVAIARRDVTAELLTAHDGGEGGEEGRAYGGGGGGPTMIRRLLLCTKANDAIDALDGIWRRLRRRDDIDDIDDVDATVIILSNGALAIRDAVYDRYGRGEEDGARRRSGRTADGVRIVLGTTTHGAYRNRPSTRGRKEEDDKDRDYDDYDDDDDDDDVVGHYDITHAGIGSTTCTDLDLVDACISIGWDATRASSDEEMDVILWRKLAANCVINPLSAIHGVENGRLLDAMMHARGGGGVEDAMMRSIATGILEEVSAVAIAEMRSIREAATASATGDDALMMPPSLAESLSVSSMEEFVFGVMSSTRDNVSSMLQDVEARRSTEVRFLNGYVASLGRERHGIECPRNDEMCRLVEGLKSSPRPSARGM